MSKHTPGPWEVSVTKLGDLSHGDLVGVNLPGSKQIHLGEYSDAEEQANAHLIAAAPEMLEALILATEQFEREYLPAPLDGHAALIKRLRSTIAKAEGRP